MQDETRSIYEGDTEVSPEIQALADHLQSLANGSQTKGRPPLRKDWKQESKK